MNETLIKDETETITMEEIERRFDGEWVLLNPPLLDDKKQVTGGTLVSHSADRAEIDRHATALKAKHIAVLYIGEAPEEIWINL